MSRTPEQQARAAGAHPPQRVQDIAVLRLAVLRLPWAARTFIEVNHPSVPGKDRDGKPAAIWPGDSLHTRGRAITDSRPMNHLQEGRDHPVPMRCPASGPQERPLFP